MIHTAVQRKNDATISLKYRVHIRRVFVVSELMFVINFNIVDVLTSLKNFFSLAEGIVSHLYRVLAV